MINFALLIPEFALTGLAISLLATDLFLDRRQKGWLSLLCVLSLVAVILVTIPLIGSTGSLYNGLFLVDGYTHFFRILFPLMSIFIVLISVDFVKLHLRYPGEYYGLILLATLAMIIMAAAGEIITAYISLELLNFCLYVLTSYAKDDPRSNEAGVKYIILSAFASALLLYGFSILYGMTGTTYYSGIAQALQSTEASTPGLFLALALITAGLGFKVAAVPFHMWTPDVYEGAPVPITAFIAVASKAAGFALLLRLFSLALGPAIDQWSGIIAIMAVVTMTVGNLVAIQQRNIKRLLAYSSISQVGYLLMGVAALNPMSASALVLHVVGYGASNLAVFLCVTVYFNQTAKENISDYSGLAERAPFLAFALTISLFSLAGMPIFAGFITKFYLFTAVAQAGLLWLSVVAIINSMVSLYYYLQVVRYMYIGAPSEPGRLGASPLANMALALLVLAVTGIGVYPAPLVRAVDAAVRALGL
ncbi:MAG: NADH-quinone oxidoreductase subunit [Dehalococcoidia bacterium]|nr:NADH-quinone oxidoreductase subunit [Dehalococcoidia bacterium]